MSDPLRPSRRALFERLGWHVAERADTMVARAIVEEREVDEVHNLDEAGLLNSFMAPTAQGPKPELCDPFSCFFGSHNITPYMTT